MAQRSDKTARNAVGKRPDGRRTMRHALVLLVGLVAVVALTVFACRQGWEYLFRRNPRFGLIRIDIESSGYWGKDAETRRLMASMVEVSLKDGLPPGVAATVFSGRLGDIRRALEAVPSIESASVERILPGVLRVRLVERTPRAFVNGPGSLANHLVIDDEGRLMESRYCLNTSALPVIVSDRSWRIGDDTGPLKAAVEVLAAARIHYPDIRIRKVSAVDPECVGLSINFRGGGTLYTVLMSPESFEENLWRLQRGLEDLIRSGEPYVVINMLYRHGITLQ